MVGAHQLPVWYGPDNKVFVFENEMKKALQEAQNIIKKK